MRWVMAVGSLAILLLCASCSGSTSSQSIASVCTPGATQVCVGTGACRGAQVCLASGAGFGSCDCGAASGAIGASGLASGSASGSAQVGTSGQTAPSGMASGGGSAAGNAGASAGGSGTMVGASGSASGYGAGTDGDAGVADAKASLAEAEAGTTKPTQCTPSGIQIAVSALPQWPMPNSSLDVANGAPNPQSYTDNGDGTVTDKVTGLMWQQTAPPGLYTPANAELYCKLLTTGNHCDWRAPEFIELYSIVDYSQRNPAIDPTFFLGTLIDAVYWSATPDKFGSYFAVFFYDGSASGGPSTGTNLAHVRCVRFTVPYTVPVGVHPPRYTTSKDDAGTGTVYDPVTKLTWQQTPTTMLFNLANAKTYCPGLAGGWRFPTAKELMTLNPIDPTVFPYFANVSYWWSSTALVAAPNVVYMPFNSWYVNLYSSQVEYGLALSSAGGSMDRLMCVR